MKCLIKFVLMMIGLAASLVAAWFHDQHIFKGLVDLTLSAAAMVSGFGAVLSVIFLFLGFGPSDPNR